MGFRAILFLSTYLFFASAVGFTLKYEASAVIPNGLIHQKTVVGGLSGIVYNNDKIYAVSDDTGRVSEPRFYILNITFKKNSLSVSPLESVIVDPKKKFLKQEDFLDQEGMAKSHDGHFFISTEGRMNSIPRQAARIFKIQADGAILSELKIPEKFSPDTLGEQKKGIQNNLGFEGLTTSEDGTTLYAMTEAPLFQDELMPEGSVTRLLVWKPKESSESFKEHFYKLEPLSQTDQGVEVFKGPSEILEVSENKLLVLERGVRLSKTLKRSYTASLFLVDFTKATDISKLKNLKMPDVVYPEKTKLLDFESNYSGIKNKVVENFEAMSWGPLQKDGKKTLIIASDNNFSKNEKTEFVLFKVEE